MSQRIDRVDELLRQEIGALLAKEVADPRIGFATITDVETSPDLRHAKVWVSVIGQKADRDETQAAPDQADPGPPCPARRLGGAGDARPASAARARDRHRPRGDRTRQ